MVLKRPATAVKATYSRRSIAKSYKSAERVGRNGQLNILVLAGSVSSWSLTR
ncbi:MAG: hypothetical protein ACSLE8_09450 [Rhodococcus sp. (in: high G+C Gram-positive bacteria)]